ncbi:MAG: nuclear transport factor 2 family protein [Pseudomonadales bacterium]
MSEAFKVGDRFFSAIEAGDMQTLRDIYHPDVVVWHNTDGLEKREQGQSREDNVALLTMLTARISDWKYDIWYREVTESGLVQQHTLRGKLPNGELFAIPVCIVLQIEDGRITRLDEYMDSVHTQPMVQALAGATKG